MSIGYKVYESNQTYEEQGITGQVERYVRGNMEFPCYIVRNEEDKKVGKHQIQVLKSMFEHQEVYMDKESKEDTSIHIYYMGQGQTLKVGKIYPKQVTHFLTLFKDNYVDCFLTKDKALKDEYMYALSSQ